MKLLGIFIIVLLYSISPIILAYDAPSIPNATTPDNSTIQPADSTDGPASAPGQINIPNSNNSSTSIPEATTPDNSTIQPDDSTDGPASSPGEINSSDVNSQNNNDF